MPNGQFNPLATLATSARQINEQANQVVKSLGDSFTQTTSQLLTSAAQGLPALPPLPGAQASNPGSNPGNHRGNPNGGNSNGAPNGGFPTLQQLIPARALQTVSQVEDVLLPPGLPRPSQALFQATGAKPRRQAPAPAVEATAATLARVGVTAGVEGANSRRPGRALGIQAV